MPRLFQPFVKAANAFFRHDLTLKRQEGAVHVVLEPPKETPKSRREQRGKEAERKDQAELVLAREQLAALLDDVPETRQALKHLVFVEQALAKKGFRALHKLPLPVLQRALEQLEGLVTNWSPAGLANLRSKMAVAIIDRENMDPEAEADAYRTAAVLDNEPGPSLPSVEEHPVSTDDDQALAAAYAALGAMAPDFSTSPGAAPVASPEPAAAAEPEPAAALPRVALTPPAAPAEPPAVEMQAELGSPSARALARQVSRPPARSGTPAAPGLDIELRELQP